MSCFLAWRKSPWACAPGSNSFDKGHKGTLLQAFTKYIVNQPWTRSQKERPSLGHLVAASAVGAACDLLSLTVTLSPVPLLPPSPSPSCLYKLHPPPPRHQFLLPQFIPLSHLFWSSRFPNVLGVTSSMSWSFTTHRTELGPRSFTTLLFWALLFPSTSCVLLLLSQNHTITLTPTSSTFVLAQTVHLFSAALLQTGPTYQLPGVSSLMVSRRIALTPPSEACKQWCGLASCFCPLWVSPG